MCREMKDSGVRWIGQIPKEWKVSSFKNIVSFIVDNRGKTPPIEDSGIPLLEIDSLRNKYPDISCVRKFLSQQTYDSFLRKYLKGGDILFATVGAIGKTSIVPEEFNYCIAQNIVGFRINESNDKLFWFYYMKSEAFKMTYLQFNKGNIQDSIKISNLMNGKIVQPLISEQQKIANYLDKKVSKIDNIISKQKSLIEKYKAYKQSLITETVTKGLNKNVPMKDSGIEWIGEIPSHWSVCKMKNIGEAIIGLTYSPEEVSDKGTLVLRSSNVQNGKIVYEDNVFVNKDISERLMTRIGDILICSRNGSRALIGKCAYIDELSAGKSFGAFMTIFRSKYNKFIYYTLNSAIFKFHIGTFLTSTINQLTTSNLSSIRITLPPKEEQQEISDFLDKECNSIDSVIAKKEKLIEKLEDYKKSLIYECVTGKRQVN